MDYDVVNGPITQEFEKTTTVSARIEVGGVTKRYASTPHYLYK